MCLRPPWFSWGGVLPPKPPKSPAARATFGGSPISLLEVREARTPEEVAAAGRVVGTVTLYLADGSEQWRPGDAMFRFLAVAPAARGRGVGRALFEACLARARAAGKRRMALHTTEWMATARAMYERAGFHREPEGDARLPGLHILAYAADLSRPRGQPRRQQPGSWGGGTRPTLWRNASTT